MSKDKLDEAVDALISDPHRKLFESKSEHDVLDLVIDHGLNDVLAALAAVCDLKADQLEGGDYVNNSSRDDCRFLRGLSDKLTGFAIRAEMLKL